MAVFNHGVKITKVASENLSASEYRFVKAGSTNGECSNAGDNGQTIGIRDNAPASGAHCSIVVTGIAKLTIGSGGCTPGMTLNSDANGKGIEADAADDLVGAVALETRSENEVAEVLVERMIRHS